MENYTDKIIAGIGKVTLSTNVDNSFPIVGDTVELSTKTKWAQNMTFDLDKGNNDTAHITRGNLSQQEAVSVEIIAGGDLIQTVKAENEISTVETQQLIMAMNRQLLPYHRVVLSSEITRTNESVSIQIFGENGYDITRDNSVICYVVKENGDYNNPDDVVAKINYPTSGTAPYFIKNTVGDGSDISRNSFLCTGLVIDKRGIYDIVTVVTDNGAAITKRENKLLTVTPRLAVRPTAEQLDNGEYTEIVADKVYGITLKMYETGANDLYCVFDLKPGQTNNNSGYYSALDISKIPSGKDAYTIVLKNDESKGKYYSRILVTGSTNVNEGNANGTPQFSYDAPLVFTIDQDAPLIIWGVSYSTINYLGCVHNTVWDGRGYYNLQKGIRFYRYSEDLHWQAGIFLLNGTSDTELFEVEISDTGFAAISAKTDPTNKNPWFWHGNFEQDNLIMHHSYMHDTAGEGVYLGYFTNEESDAVYSGENVTFENLAGEQVTYIKGNTYKKLAHAMNHTRIYRNRFERLGLDGMQLSNAINSEVCYNIVEKGGLKNEVDQASGISLQSMDGRIYNNIVTGFNGPGMQLGPLTDLEVFNNIISTDAEYDAIQFIWSLKSPAQNPSGGDSGVINDVMQVKIHNNVLVAGRYTANGRNTVQPQNVFFIDNLLVNNGQTFSNQTTATLTTWEENMQGNAMYLATEFNSKLQDLRIADKYNADYRIGYNSPLISKGIGTYFEYDYRGYKNWYQNIYPSGAYMGIYKDENYTPVPLSISEVIINNGDSETDNTTVSVAVTYAGNIPPTHYRVAESNNFEGAEWLPYTAAFSFELGVSAGVHTVYVQIKNSSETSDIASDTITVLQSASGNKIAVSFGSLSDDLQELDRANKFVNGVEVIGALTKGTSKNIRDSSGNEIGTILSRDADIKQVVASYATPGITVPAGLTLSQVSSLMQYGLTNNAEGSMIIDVVVPEGTYNIRLFASVHYQRACTPNVSYSIITNYETADESITPLVFTNIDDNTDEWMSAQIVVPASGFIIKAHRAPYNAYTIIPLNIMILEKVTE